MNDQEFFAADAAPAPLAVTLAETVTMVEPLPVLEVPHEHPQEGGSYTRNLTTGALIKETSNPVQHSNQE